MPLEKDKASQIFDAVVIGAGISGMYQLYSLRKLGKSVKVLEAGSDVGGTWYWNRYPGASCDIESYVYLPLLEKTGFVPQQKYTNASETLDYCNIIAEKYRLHERAMLQTLVTSTDWDEDLGRWMVSTNRQDRIKARYVVHSNGPLNRPKLPAIRGINDFTGHTFHTSRWDYAYTGGNSNGNLNNLRDKKVAIIGTGATAVPVSYTHLRAHET